MASSHWYEVLDSLTDLLKDQLNGVKNTNIIEFCFRHKELRKEAENFLQDCRKQRLKNNAIALEKKEEGNKKYKEKKYEESLLLYTESILHAEKNDECLPLAYSNRSLLLQEMGHVSECFQDIDMALSTGYPKNKREKLILRKAKCLIQMGEVDKARGVLKEALKKPGDISKIIEQELRNLKNFRNDNVQNMEQSLPELVGGRNENFVSASKHVSVVYNKAKGRHVIATHDIQIGDVLLVEKPFAFVMFRKSCHGCCKEMIASIPCWNCLDVTYCSPKCRDDSWNFFHAFECGYRHVFKSVGIAHLSLRIILSASSSFSQLKAILSQLKEPKYEDRNVSFKSNGYDSVYYLVNNIEKYEAKDLFQYAMSALLLALHLKNHTQYFGENSQDEEDLKLLTTTIWRHIMQLICNGHAIVGLFCGGSEENLAVTETEERIGTAIYPSASMMNHSCEPSIINSFYKNYLIVRASKVIRKGEEVFNCYGPHARRMRRKRRQEILREQYFFKCECQCCLLLFDIQDKLTALKCENCKGPSVPEENRESLICLKCGEVSQASPEVLRKQDLYSSLMEQGKVLAGSDNILALKTFLRSWFLGREIFYKFNKYLCYAADEVAKCLFNVQDYKRCVMFLKCCLLSVEEQFGAFSIELAHEMKKTGAIITCWVNLESNESREFARLGVDYYERAEKIIGLLHGLHHPDLEKIRENKGILQDVLNKFST